MTQLSQEDKDFTDNSYIKKIALHGTPEELDFLIKNGVDVNADYGCATLLTASINGLKFGNIEYKNKFYEE